MEAAGGGTPSLSHEQVEMVQKHLALVFKHEIDPRYPEGAALDVIHNPPSKPSFTGEGGIGGAAQPGLRPRC